MLHLMGIFQNYIGNVILFLFCFPLDIYLSFFLKKTHILIISLSTGHSTCYPETEPTWTTWQNPMSQNNHWNINPHMYIMEILSQEIDRSTECTSSFWHCEKRHKFLAHFIKSYFCQWGEKYPTVCTKYLIQNEWIHIWLFQFKHLSTDETDWISKSSFMSFWRWFAILLSYIWGGLVFHIVFS